jgi:hypothetical protein
MIVVGIIDSRYSLIHIAFTVNHVIMTFALILSNISFYVPMYLSEENYNFACCFYGCETWCLTLRKDY